MTPPDEVLSLGASLWRARLAKNWNEAKNLRGRLALLGWRLIDIPATYRLEPNK